MAVSKVIRYLRRKSADGFSEPITYIGAEQRFVEALRNSSVNNLEEQYIFGTDVQTVLEKDADGHMTKTKIYRIEGKGEPNYYKMVSTFYDSEMANTDFYFSGTGLYTPDTYEEFGTVPNADAEDVVDSLICLNRVIYQTDNEILRILPSSTALVRKDELFFVRSGGQEIKVLTKEVWKYYEEGNKVTVTEKVTNHLKEGV